MRGWRKQGEKGKERSRKGRFRGKIVREGRWREGEGQESAVSVTKCMEWAFILHRTHEVCMACTGRGIIQLLDDATKIKLEEWVGLDVW